MTVTHKTVPIEISVRTPWGAVKVPPITFAVLPGSDDVVLFGVATMKALGLDLYPWDLEKLRPSAVPVETGVESPSFLDARRVTLPVVFSKRGCGRCSCGRRGGASAREATRHVRNGGEKFPG